jgi:hypothetical protein
MIVVLNSENVCDDCQIRILACTNKFINNVKYLEKSKEKLDMFFTRSEPVEDDGKPAPDTDVNLWVEIPQMIKILIDLHKSVTFVHDIDQDYMKFVLYGIIYNYLDTHHADILGKLEPGHFRIYFLNLLEVLLTKPKKIEAVKQSVLSSIFGLCCDDDDKVVI